jgi:copper chaperone
MDQSVIAVTGLTFEHCAKAVRAEIAGIAGVTQVEVDLQSGNVAITADPVPERAAMRAAVEAAGYALAD